MNNILIKTASMALSGLLLLGALSACGGGGQTNGGTPTTSMASVTAGDTSAAQLSPNVPAADYQGYTFTFLAHEVPELGDWISMDPRELVAESETGDLINDAVYKRNSVISQQYNVQFAMYPSQDEWGALNKSVKAGDNAYDAAVIFNGTVPAVITNNMLLNVSNLQYVDLTKPWWDQGANGMTIDNQCYVLAGDLMILDKEATECLLFNKDLIQSLGLQSPYDLVTGGAWTFDALYQMIKGSALDLNGDGIIDYNDRVGLLTFNDTLHAFLVAGGGQLAVKDASDEPVMTLGDATCLNIAAQAMSVLYDQRDVLNWQALTPAGQQAVPLYQTIFTAGHALFMWARMVEVEMIRDADVNFGIIPMPKLTSSQANYLSVVNPITGAMLGVPITCPDTARTSAILEALSCESMYTLQPAYYDETLQRKMIRDTESSGMLDIIFGNRVYDIGAVYAFGDCFMGYIGLCKTYDTDVASYYAKNQGKMDADIKKAVKVFQSNT